MFVACATRAGELLVVFFSLTCFTVGVWCADEFAVCFVCVCTCFVPFYLWVSRANFFVFTCVVVSLCLLRDPAHTLVSTLAVIVVAGMFYSAAN